jgi:hypothetical protein
LICLGKHLTEAGSALTLDPKVWSRSEADFIIAELEAVKYASTRVPNQAFKINKDAARFFSKSVSKQSCF